MISQSVWVEIKVSHITKKLAFLPETTLSSMLTASGLQWESYMYSQNFPTIIQRTPLYYEKFCWSLWFLKSHITVKHSTSISCKQCLLQEQTTYCPNITSATTHMVCPHFSWQSSWYRHTHVMHHSHGCHTSLYIVFLVFSV